MEKSTKNNLSESLKEIRNKSGISLEESQKDMELMTKAILENLEPIPTDEEVNKILKKESPKETKIKFGTSPEYLRIVKKTEQAILKNLESIPTDEEVNKILKKESLKETKGKFGTSKEYLRIVEKTKQALLKNLIPMTPEKELRKKYNLDKKEK